MRIRILGLLSMVVLLGTGCVRVNDLHYLRGDFTVSSQWGLPLSAVYAAPDLAFIKGKTLAVKVDDPTRTIEAPLSKIDPSLDAKFWATWQKDFEGYVANRVWSTSIFSDVCAASDYDALAQPDLICKIALTEWNEGNKWKRYFIGFGAGGTRVQWEGLIVDAQSGRVLFAFADASLHPGGPSFMDPIELLKILVWDLGIKRGHSQKLGWGRKVFYGPKLIAEDLRFSSEDLAVTLRRTTGIEEPKRLPFRPFTRPKQAAPQAKVQPAASPPVAGTVPAAIPPPVVLPGSAGTN